MDDITVMVIDVMDNSFDSSTASRKDDISSGSGMSRPFSEAAEEAPKVSAGCFCFSSKANQ